ncbi:MAG: malto-oligosyltrehalose trehalohydrolase [Desulfobacterales bacterium]|nr:MAG: malto-oligosyltrehalose trehalohydrolase [Desulfobacterales bacterium]
MTRHRLGATYLGRARCRFLVWAPRVPRMELHIVAPDDRIISMALASSGYHHAEVEGIEPGSRYLYRLRGESSGGTADRPCERPDPASRFQPEGVHGPSQVETSAFDWEDADWHGLPLSQYIFYELHVGTFTPAGTFEAIIAHLDELRELGITAVELMPVAQFPGSRNWGYDGTYPFAVQNSYGGPVGLKRLVDACHRKALAVVLDVVYNHLGPEGNYLGDFAPYFTDFYRTPWGGALNFDGPHSDEVRRYFLENALYWITEFRIDALRLDAVHAILDFSAQPFLEELALAVHRQAQHLNRRIYCIAESALNDTRLIRPRELGGFDLDAQWNDDFHHALHTLLTGEQSGYYQDFGRLSDLAQAWREGFVYAGRYSAYRRRRHGNSSRNIPARRLVVFAQNHDQIGNRLGGERLSRLVSFEGLKLSAGLVLLSPFLPLLFMGEEYGEAAPFPYFISHLDPALVEAVRQGRRQEFAAFGWQEEPPDPQDEQTFRRAKLDHSRHLDKTKAPLRAFYRELLRLRKAIAALAQLSQKNMEVIGDDRQNMLFVRRWSDEDEVCLVFHFRDRSAAAMIPIPAGRWEKGLDSGEKRWQGPASCAPATIASPGEVQLTLPPHVVLLWTRGKERLAGSN